MDTRSPSTTLRHPRCITFVFACAAMSACVDVDPPGDGGPITMDSGGADASGDGGPFTMDSGGADASGDGGPITMDGGGAADAALAVDAPFDAPPVEDASIVDPIDAGLDAWIGGPDAWIVVDAGHDGGPAPGDAGPDPPPTCGNGRVDPLETCDTAIASGGFGACPSSCPSVDACAQIQLVGSACTLACEVTTTTVCGASDGCCPAGCTTAGDPDCFDTCLRDQWSQYRADELHSGLQSSVNQCEAWSAAAAPRLVWSRDLGGPVWNSPAIYESTTDVEIQAVATIDGHPRATGLSPAGGATVWALDAPTDTRLVLPGWMSLYANGTEVLVLSSPSGGVHTIYTSPTPSTGATFSQRAQSFPNVMIRRAAEPGDLSKLYVEYLSSSNRLMLSSIAGLPERTYDVPRGSCVSSANVGYRVVDLAGYRTIFSAATGFDTFVVYSGLPPATLSCASAGRLVGAPVRLPRSEVAIAYESGQLLVRRMPSIERLWAVTVTDMFSGPVSDRYGRIYVGAGSGGDLVCAHSGRILWRASVGTTFDSPALTDDGTVLIGGADGTLYAVRDGAVRWSVPLAGVLTSPIVTRDGLIVVGSSNGFVYALRND